MDYRDVSTILAEGTRVVTAYGNRGTVIGRSVYGTALVHFDTDEYAYFAQEWPDEHLIVLK